MTHLNSLPNQILNTLQLNSAAHCINPYPGHIHVIQDMDMYHYRLCLSKLIFPDSSLISSDKEKVEWQTREAYRIINAALASKRVSNRYKPILTTIHANLELEAPIHTAIEKIANKEIIPDIICSGHGGWSKEDGTIDLRKYNAKVAFYCKFGSIISDSLGVNIENDEVSKKDILIQSIDDPTLKSSLDNKTHYPVVLSNRSQNPIIPNFILSAGKEMKARLLENGTGYVLYESDYSISLKEILDAYPNNRIHWAACMFIYDEQFKQRHPETKEYRYDTTHQYKRFRSAHNFFASEPPEKKQKHYNETYLSQNKSFP